ncbi:MAG: hypothetical protein ABIB71_02550 [Candidatus Woesearchaeota archaeon]
MLDEKRIKEAEKNVREYIQSGMLKKQPFREEILKVLKDNANDSLEAAEFLSENSKSDLWIIVTSYYSMFYIANAVLFKIGYKVGDKIAHKVTADALIVHVRNKLKKRLLEEYEEAQNEALPGIKADTLIDEFDKERAKRGTLQYQTTSVEKHSKAITSLKRAKSFIFEMEKLLGDLK